jgi:Acetyltransferases
MKEDLVIRQVNANDAGNLAVLLQQVWIATYAEEGIRIELSNYVLNEFTLEKIQRRLLDNGKICLIAEKNSHLRGYVEVDYNAVCPEQSITFPEVTVLYVLERFKGQGIGRLLLANVERLLVQRGCKGYWLTVYHLNRGAIDFYCKMGFNKVGVTYFEMDGNRYENWIMLKYLG